VPDLPGFKNLEGLRHENEIKIRSVINTNPFEATPAGPEQRAHEKN